MIGPAITYILRMMKLRQKEVKQLTYNYTEICGSVLNHYFLWPSVLPQWGIWDKISNHILKSQLKKKNLIGSAGEDFKGYKE